jgi:predicted metalloprotease with PDZ domain
MCSVFLRVYVLLLLLLASDAYAASPAGPSYPLQYTLAFDQDTREAIVGMRLGAHNGVVRRFNLKMPLADYSAIEGAGTIVREGDRLLWTPPAAGGSLSWRHKIDHVRRTGGAYDARFARSWAMFRGDDVFPAALVRTKGKAASRTTLVMKLPAGWHADTPFQRIGSNSEQFNIDFPGRRFDRPVGWMIAGKIGARSEFIEGTKVVVAAPRGESIHRQDVLAFMSWNLPHMARAFGQLPDKLLFVSAGDPMWRGGLSAPRSLFLHMDRPLISENATSPPLHELTHVITRIRGEKGADWFTEGLAEFYGLEILRRSGGISQARFEKALAWQKNWSRDVDTLKVNRSRGKTTARAVLLIKALDDEIRKQTDGKRSIDHVTRRLMKIGKVSNQQINAVVEEVIGAPSKVLDTSLLR